MNSPKKINPKETGPPHNRPKGTTSSVLRATVKPSSTVKNHFGNLGRTFKPATDGAKAQSEAASSTGPSTSKSALALQSSAIKPEKSVPAGNIASASSGIEKWPILRVVDPAKASYQDRRNAARLLRRFHANPTEQQELTIEVKESIERAKAIIPDFNPDYQLMQPAPKRQRSLEEAKPTAKRPKTLGVTPKKSFAEIAKDRIIIGVLDENHPEGIIPKSQWKWVEAALSKVALKVILGNPGAPPACEDLGWHQGQIKIVACENERSVQLYKTAISQVGEVYPNAKLVVVDKKDIPSRPRARVWVPSTPEDPEEIMQLIRVCNPEIPTKEWKFVKIEQRGNANEAEVPQRATMQVMLLLTDESIEPLAKRDGELMYGFIKIKVKVYKTDAEAIELLASNEEAEPMSETEPMSEDEPLAEEEYASSGSEMGLGRMYFEKRGKYTTCERKYSERELLCERREDPDVTLTANASSTD